MLVIFDLATYTDAVDFDHVQRCGLHTYAILISVWDLCSEYTIGMSVITNLCFVGIMPPSLCLLSSSEYFVARHHLFRVDGSCQGLLRGTRVVAVLQEATRIQGFPKRSISRKVLG